MTNSTYEVPLLCYCCRPVTKINTLRTNFRHTQCLHFFRSFLFSWQLSWDICPLRHTNNCTVICSWHFSFQQTKENKFYSSQYECFSKYLSVTRANVKFLRRRSPWMSVTSSNNLALFFKCNIHKLHSVLDVIGVLNGGLWDGWACSTERVNKKYV